MNANDNRSIINNVVFNGHENIIKLNSNSSNINQIKNGFNNKIFLNGRGSLRDSDLACRMGGDEFAAALFFKKENDTEFMYSRARQIFDRISAKLAKAEHPTALSMGAVVAEHENMTFKQVYEASDKALYRSKKDGRGRLSVELATLS